MTVGRMFLSTARRAALTSRRPPIAEQAGPQGALRSMPATPVTRRVAGMLHPYVLATAGWLIARGLAGAAHSTGRKSAVSGFIHT